MSNIYKGTELGDKIDAGLKEVQEYLTNRPMLIYVSGPFTLGDQWANVRTACLAGNEILKLGHCPFVPHCTAIWHVITPKTFDRWLEIDSVILARCDAVLRLPGESKGADREVALALEKHIEVYTSLGEIPKR